MPNIKSNHKEEQPPSRSDKKCNCRRGTDCPLSEQCLTPCIIYQATVTRQVNQSKGMYIGLSEMEFKDRYNNHKHSFRNPELRNVWNLKDSNCPHEIEWKLIAKSKAYSTSSKKCNLCLTEKFFIICKPHMATLNTRNELASGCRHKKRHLLCSI